ncbi:MAG: response regulator transcription factor [Chloroflexota bacterium]
MNSFSRIGQNEVDQNSILSDAFIGGDRLKVLVAEDEKVMRDILTMSLQRLGYEVVTVTNGVEAVTAFGMYDFDLLLLDVLMPEMDGFVVCSEIRKRSDVPIIMLTALSRPDDIVRGLELGADNYITKPFTFKEVEARIRAILRRSAVTAEKQTFSILEHGDIRINDEISEVTVNSEYVELTRTEYRLLHYLINHANQPVSKDELLQGVWGYESADSPNLVELAIRRLRKKIEDNASRPKRLVTVRGFGYKLTDNTEKRRQPHPDTLPTIPQEYHNGLTDTHRNLNTEASDLVDSSNGQVTPASAPKPEQPIRTTY